jgi:hypothetical protein
VKNLAFNALTNAIGTVSAAIETKPTKELCEALHILLMDLYQARQFPAKETLNNHTERIAAMESRLKTLEAINVRKAQVTEPRALVQRMG